MNPLVPLELDRRQRLSNPAIAPSLFTPDQAAWRAARPKITPDDPVTGEQGLTLVQHRQADLLTLVSDAEATPDGWIPEGGGWGELWGNGRSW